MEPCFPVQMERRSVTCLKRYILPDELSLYSNVEISNVIFVFDRFPDFTSFIPFSTMPRRLARLEAEENMMFKPDSDGRMVSS